MVYSDTLENVKNILPLTTSFISSLVLEKDGRWVQNRRQPYVLAILLVGLIYNENIPSGFIHCGKHLVIAIMTFFSAIHVWIPCRNRLMDIKPQHKPCAAGDLAAVASQVGLICKIPLLIHPSWSTKSPERRTLPAGLEAWAPCRSSCPLCLFSSNCRSLYNFGNTGHCLWGVYSDPRVSSVPLPVAWAFTALAILHCIEIACFLAFVCFNNGSVNENWIL